MRFTIKVKHLTGRPQTQRSDTPGVAWELFASNVRRYPEATVTLHDKLTDIEVTG